MKHYILIIFLIMIVGASLIVLPHVLKEKGEERTVEKAKIETIENEILVMDNQSTLNTIQASEHIQQESELFDPEQMYFENIEVLYEHLKFGHVDTVKQRVQFYIHSTYGKHILDCILDKDSIKDLDSIVTFDISFDGKTIGASVELTENGEIADISIVDSSIE